MDNREIMEAKVIPSLLKILARDQVELSHNSSDPVWVQRHITQLIRDKSYMWDHMINTYEKDGDYPEFKGQSISEILDIFLSSYLKGCQEMEDLSADQLFTHGYA